jgi:hypothetical protein
MPIQALFDDETRFIQWIHLDIGADCLLDIQLHIYCFYCHSVVAVPLFTSM